MDKYFEVGQIVNTNGLKGMLKIKPFTDDIKEFEEFKTIYIQKKAELVEFRIQMVRYVKNMVLLKLEGIDDIDEAEKYRNLYLKVERSKMPELPEDTYYVLDLIDCEVITIDGETLGKVDDVFSTGSNDVYVVKNESGKQILLPAIGEVVKDVDVPNKKITVKLMEGLL